MAPVQNSIQAETIRLAYDDDSAAGAAGTYSASVSLPAGAIVTDVIVHGVALWNAGTSAVLKVGDAADDDGFYTAVDLKATDLLAGESLSFAYPAGQFGAYLSVDYTSVATIGAGYVDTRYSASNRVITATATLVGTAATTGETLITVVYISGTSPSESTFTAA